MRPSARLSTLLPALALASLVVMTVVWSQAPPAPADPAEPAAPAEPPAPAAPAPAAPAPAPAPASPPPGCDAPEHRQFDFWVGEWDVFNPAGKHVGASSIRLILGGCVVLENWKGDSGVEGTSLNIYDRVDRRWHQAWVDGSGSRLDLAGGLRGASMVLSGVSAAPTGGGKVTERITWSPVPGGKVRQLWEQSADGGESWTVAFDGTYVPRGSTGAGATGDGGSAAGSADQPGRQAARG